jgi:transposase
MRFVPVKTKAQQSALVMHRGRELLIRQRTMLANALRGHLAEFGLIAAQGLHNVAGLIVIVRNDEDGRVPDMARRVLRVIADAIVKLDTQISGGSIRTIPATVETENTRSYQGGVWLGDLDSNHD